MSYSFSLQVREGQDDGSSIAIENAVLDKGLESLKQLSDPVRPEMDEHIEVAAKTVALAITSGAFGKGRLVSVMISGHAEPGHTKREGWSQDGMSISFSQVQEE